MLTALRQDPAWAGDPSRQFRYAAAGFAMVCADGKDMNNPAAAERTAYRKRALELMTGDLAAIRKLAAIDRAYVPGLMQHWLGNPDLASVREPTALEKLPPDEREAWRKLWADVRELRDRSAPQAGPRSMSR
jgi:hypothetical protein